MRVVVCTIVHHPADARIYHRQIRALLDAGHEVTYVAPVAQDFYSERTWPSLQLTAVPRALKFRTFDGGWRAGGRLRRRIGGCRDTAGLQGFGA
jgi:hypothetical protein